MSITAVLLLATAALVLLAVLAATAAALREGQPHGGTGAVGAPPAWDAAGLPSTSYRDSGARLR